MFLLDHYRTSQIKPIISGSYCQRDYEQKMYMDKMDNNTTEDSCSFSLFSQTEDNISQSVEETKNALSCELPIVENNFYETVFPAFQAAVEICNTVEDAQALSDQINSFISQAIAKRGNHTIHDDGLSFFGENLSHKNDKFERHKFAYEKRRITQKR